MGFNCAQCHDENDRLIARPLIPVPPDIADAHLRKSVSEQIRPHLSHTHVAAQSAIPRRLPRVAAKPLPATSLALLPVSGQTGGPFLGKGANPTCMIKTARQKPRCLWEPSVVRHICLRAGQGEVRQQAIRRSAASTKAPFKTGCNTELAPIVFPTGMNTPGIGSRVRFKGAPAWHASPMGRYTKGEFSKGKPRRSSARSSFADGGTYEGSWHDGKIHRQRHRDLCQWRCAMKASFQQWHFTMDKGTMHGPGNGYLYEGDWVNGVKEQGQRQDHLSGPIAVYDGRVADGDREASGRRYADHARRPDL